VTQRRENNSPRSPAASRLAPRASDRGAAGDLARRRAAEYEAFAVLFSSKAGHKAALEAPQPHHAARTLPDFHPRGRGQSSPPLQRVANQRGTPRGESTSSNESLQRRQIELLTRIDENLRRLRELAESRVPAPAVFTEPAH